MDQPVNDLREMLLAVTKALADYPDNLRIDSICEDKTMAFWVYVHSKDAGKLIGVNGRTAHALRVILQANAVKLQRRLTLDICPLTDDQS